MLFKDISYLEIGGSFVQRREPFMQFLLEGIHYQEQLCEIILYLDQCFRCRLKTFYLELW